VRVPQKRLAHSRQFCRSSSPVDTLHGDQVNLDHINDPEPAHAQTVILTLVKTLRRVGI
jgi:hypothetical protein